MTELGRVSWSHVVVRSLVVVGALAALGFTRAAGSSVLALEVVNLCGALACVWIPDSHLPAGVTVLIGVHWLIAVDDAATPWVIGVGAAIALLHVAAASSGVGPIAAGWTGAMRRRWLRWLGLAALATAPAWVAVAITEEADVGGSSALVAIALLAVASGLLWLGASGRRAA